MRGFGNLVLRLFACRRVAISEFPNSPALLAMLWIAVTAANVVDVVVWPDPAQFTFPSSVLHIAGGVILAAFVAAWAIGRNAQAIRIGIAFMLLGLAMNLVWLAGQVVASTSQHFQTLLIWALFIWELGAIASLLRKSWGGAKSWRGTAVATALFAAIVLIGPWARDFDSYLISLSARMTPDKPDVEDYAPIDHETLWPAQPGLVDTAASALRGKVNGVSRTSVLTIAAGGSQDLFGREAKAALAVLSDRFGPDAGGAELSNAREDLMHLPLANRSNLSVIIQKAGAGFDNRRDTMVIYLAAHGSRKAELGTNLPDYSSLKPISAQGLSQALDSAGIKRRIVIVSACYAGTWIEPLHSPDTIVITAARADRTSFGCDDDRQFTVFGEAFINGSLRHGASLQQAFDDLKRRVDNEEKKSGARPSLPQVFVGQRMQSAWTAQGFAPPPR